tara:strand:- start:894 stop:2084 length:1191 start_codon:yes stop_codon:yes gene_type:complete
MVDILQEDFLITRLPYFNIDETELDLTLDLDKDSIEITSVPRDYEVKFTNNVFNEILKNNIKDYSQALFIIDENIANLYKDKLIDIFQYPHLIFSAKENNKDIFHALDVCDFLLENNANRTSCLYAIGGGIIQDIAAYAAATYKRGIPWVYIPTTLLGQSDSCVGGKTGLNYKGTKNLVALFSAPRKVLIDINFFSTLNHTDIFSGFGEIIRLVITGGSHSYQTYKSLKEKLLRTGTYSNPDLSILKKIVKLSLQVKKSVVQADEFELNLRKSMNYGHSVGHAIEIMSNFQIPHGQAVAVGILVENQIASYFLNLDEKIIDDISNCIHEVLPKDVFQQIKNLRNKSFLELFRNDKKSEGNILKLATLSSLGDMRFINFELNSKNDKLVQQILTNMV